MEDSILERIQQFWNYFATHQEELAQISSMNDPAHQTLLEKLQYIDRVIFELSTDPNNKEFIITAQGNKALFILIEHIVSKAPSMEGWDIIALKPKYGFPAQAQWEDFRIATADLVFDPLTRKGLETFGVRVFVPELDPKERDKAYQAISRAIDDGIGERMVGEKVKYLEVASFPSDASPEAFIPLLKLEQYIAMHNKKFAPPKTPGLNLIK